MMLDHCLQTCLCPQHGPEGTKSVPAIAKTPREAQRHRSVQEATGPVSIETDPPCQISNVPAATGEQVRHAKANERQKHLGMNKTGREIEESPGAPTSQEPG